MAVVITKGRRAGIYHLSLANSPHVALCGAQTTLVDLPLDQWEVDAWGRLWCGSCPAEHVRQQPAKAIPCPGE
jgi:hypothetical protein